ncbi:hypothetical protein GGI15_002051 [Coemansia interrupta]|uniref:Uncharacterized protein n=1 Tax=Coemansia interrupta TaxID=1126814 RepID=A0A9W8LL98_9FUNG|nr:hypothetical protein GGI15_002051 [Coemansia interrupta]
MASHFGLGAYPIAYSPTMNDTSDQWLFRKEDLLAIPSNTSSQYSSPVGKHGSPDTHNWRARGCLFIHNVARLLGLRQVIASTACVYFHRFYMRQSVTQYQQYKWQLLLKSREIAVLENCCFDLDITHPYIYIDKLAMEFGIPVYIANSATAHVNDSMRSPLCLLYKPEVVAVAALYFAMSVHKWSFNRYLFNSQAVKLPANAQLEVKACIMDILDFYSSEAKAENEAFKLQQQQQQRRRRQQQQQHRQKEQPRRA